MPSLRPVAAIEVYLHLWSVPLLVCACIYRLLLGYLRSGQVWLSDMQLLVVCLLLAVLLFSGSLLGQRSASLAVSLLAGSAAWVVVSTLIPPSLWSGYSLLRSAVADWLLITAGVAALSGFVTRAWLARSWLKQLSGHGYRWMLDWAQPRPLYARLLVQRVLVNLGYSFDD